MRAGISAANQAAFVSSVCVEASQLGDRELKILSSLYADGGAVDREVRRRQTLDADAPKLPSHSYGSYPIIYVDKRDRVLCAECATEANLSPHDGFAIESGDVDIECEGVSGACRGVIS